MQQLVQDRRRLILLILVVVVLLCLVGALAYNLFFAGGDDVAGGDTPTPTATPTQEGPDVVITPEEEDTPTPTRVISEQPTEEPTEEPTAEPTDEGALTPEATAEPPTPIATSTGADFTLSPSDTESASVTYETDQLLTNGGFETGYDDSGVGEGWQFFKTDGAVISFSGETQDTLIKEGSGAQRISIQEAIESNRFAGIYQTLDVVANKPYTLTINGQVRSLFGDVDKSGYGYRVQYAVDLDGGDDWRVIPEEDWTELPWGEELYGAENPEFSEYTTEITPTGDTMTLFIRVWNKWPDPALVEYTFDSLSLVGPDPSTASGMVVRVATGDEEMVDGALPVTGDGDLANFMTDGRFWGAVLVLLLLVSGAVYRARWAG